MKLGDIKIIDRISVVEAIKRLNEEDLRLNKKTVGVVTADGHQWYVSPSLLQLIQAAQMFNDRDSYI
jgi:hypothetical protein